MGEDYSIVHSEPNTAVVLSNGKEKGTLRKNGTGSFSLDEIPKNSWVLKTKVDGEVRPFSIACYRSFDDKPNVEAPFLEIKDHVFSQKENMYSIGEALPEGQPPKTYLSGPKYLTRLVNFPYSSIHDLDHETKHWMKRHRGVAVGEFSGLGAKTFRLKLYNDELADVSLQLAAAIYLLYSTR
jgi:hypothetical protein